MFGDHAAFIVPAYVISALVLLGLVIWLKVQFAGFRNELNALEESGIKRRSAGADSTNSN